jgi:hypothetical protein
VTGWGELIVGGEERERKWIRRGRKSIWEGRTMDCSTGKGGKVRGKNRDKKIVMVKLIIQKKRKHNRKHQVKKQQKVQSFGKSSKVIP